MNSNLSELNGKTVFPLPFYDANTNRNSEQDRANAIRHMLEPLTSRNYGFAFIRYSGGYYYQYIMFNNLNDNCVMEIISYDAKINLWRFGKDDEYMVNPI